MLKGGILDRVVREILSDNSWLFKNKSLLLFISFNMHLLSTYYVLGGLLRDGNIIVDKVDKFPPFHRAFILGGGEEK